MPQYKITRTETVTVWGNDEEHATEVAIAEMQDCPNGDYEIKQLTPKVNASLHEVAVLLESFGIKPVEVFENDAHGYPPRLSIGLHKVENYKGDLVPCEILILIGNTSDGENWDGTGWQLLTCELEEVAEFPNLDSANLAGAMAYQIGRAFFDLESHGRA